MPEQDPLHIGGHPVADSTCDQCCSPDNLCMSARQMFSLAVNRHMHGGQRMQDGSDYVAESARLAYVKGEREMSTREAEAMRNLQSNQLAPLILGQRSVATQPG